MTEKPVSDQLSDFVGSLVDKAAKQGFQQGFQAACEAVIQLVEELRDRVNQPAPPERQRRLRGPRKRHEVVPRLVEPPDAAE